jgi:uncharacterized membrane protein YdjX (TVP38/TMEM64 family)
MIAHANPVLPGSSLGYMFGASVISLESFVFGVVMGTLPLQIIAVAIGHSAGNIAINFELKSLLVLVGLIAAIFIYKSIIPNVIDRLDGGAEKNK